MSDAPRREPVRFSFVLHIHQPVGNFDHVFREHADDVYRPFFDFLEERDLWPVGLHVSGPLVEWLGVHDAKLHDRIGGLASEGRIELLSAGWYEPVLAALSRDDRAGQLAWMREELVARFGVTPRGLWLTERVWIPELPADLSDAGIEYVLVDDHLVLRAGVAESDLDAPIRTEYDGRGVDLFAIDERLRYLIPFRPAEELEADLRTRHASGARLALIGDDGEKFGGWPRTKEWLYEGGWLAAFGDLMERLRGEDIVRLVTPGQAHAELEASGPVRLPVGSYPEMEEWAPERDWRGFLTRYEEAGRMHVRVSALSEECRERGDPPAVRRALGRAQCNDAYWHGVFGGLYMRHLRDGVREHAARAEAELRQGEPLAWTRFAMPAGVGTGWWAHGEAVSAWIDPRFGGTVSELQWLRTGDDLTNTLTRRREAYHAEAVERWIEQSGEGAGAGSASIHEIEAAAMLDRLPTADRDVRTLVRDRVLPAGLTLEGYREAEYEPMWEAGSVDPVDPRACTDSRGVRALEWHFRTAPAPVVHKTVRISEDGALELEWTWPVDAWPSDAVFAPELSLGADYAPDLAGDPEVWTYPIVTVSKCPDGFEEIDQGRSITPRWPVGAGTANIRLAP